MGCVDLFVLGRWGGECGLRSGGEEGWDCVVDDGDQEGGVVKLKLIVIVKLGLELGGVEGGVYLNYWVCEG